MRLDPAATARSSLGPAAYSEYEQVFGSRLVARWPRHLVLDGLETIDLLLESGNLLIHPRCSRLKEMGFTETDLARIRGPVGLAIGAVSPAEVAISITAQIIQVLRQGEAAQAP